MSNVSAPTAQAETRRQRTYLNAILTVNAALLGLLVVHTVAPKAGLESISQAQLAAAGPGDGIDDPSGRISAAEQRKQIINEIRAVGGRVERVEQILSKGLNVKVTELPAGFMKDRDAKASERSDGKGIEIRTRPADPKPAEDNASK